MVAALRLAHRGHAGQHQNPRQGHGKEGQLPREQGADQGQRHRPGVADQAHHGAAGDHGQAGPQIEAHGVNGDGPGQFLRRKVVGDHRIGRRGQRRLAHPHAHAGDEQAGKALRQAAGGGHQAPQKHADGNDGAAAAPVRQPGDGHTQETVENGERKPRQQADLGVGNA